MGCAGSHSAIAGVLLMLLLLSSTTHAQQQPEDPSIIQTSSEAERNGRTRPKPLRSGLGVETAGAQALYLLPRDHAIHGGRFYDRPAHVEWIYFTAFFEDQDTGEPISVFLSHFWPASGLGRHPPRPERAFSLLSTLELDTGKFNSSGNYYRDTSLRCSGTGWPTKQPFAYACSMADVSQRMTVEYYEANSSWVLGASTAGGAAGLFVGQVKAPGYLPAIMMGAENQGLPRPNAPLPTPFDPQQMQSLSYYYFAPMMEMTGTLALTAGSRPRRLKGLAWFEHQWGNFNSNLTYAENYVWLYARFDNGDMLTLRQWARPRFDFDPSLNRYMYLRKLAQDSYKAEYGLGPSAVFTPLGWVTNPTNGASFPVNASLTTPQGTWYVSTEHTNQFAPGSGLLYEGVAYLREGSLSGPKVARMFLELNDAE